MKNTVQIEISSVQYRTVLLSENWLHSCRPRDRNQCCSTLPTSKKSRSSSTRRTVADQHSADSIQCQRMIHDH